MAAMTPRFSGNEHNGEGEQLPDHGRGDSSPAHALYQDILRENNDNRHGAGDRSAIKEPGGLDAWNRHCSSALDQLFDPQSGTLEERLRGFQDALWNMRDDVAQGSSAPTALGRMTENAWKDFCDRRDSWIKSSRPETREPHLDGGDDAARQASKAIVNRLQHIITASKVAPEAQGPETQDRTTCVFEAAYLLQNEVRNRNLPTETLEGLNKNIDKLVDAADNVIPSEGSARALVVDAIELVQQGEDGKFWNIERNTSSYTLRPTQPWVDLYERYKHVEPENIQIHPAMVTSMFSDTGVDRAATNKFQDNTWEGLMNLAKLGFPVSLAVEHTYQIEEGIVTINGASCEFLPFGEMSLRDDNYNVRDQSGNVHNVDSYTLRSRAWPVNRGSGYTDYSARHYTTLRASVGNPGDGSFPITIFVP